MAEHVFLSRQRRGARALARGLVECSADGGEHDSRPRQGADAPACRAAAARARRAARRLFLIDGPSLVYRAFFALPESIATSTGVPTNAIFGFASMLVKIVTEYGVCPTIVAWDAGTSGRTEMFAEYKAQRRSRPDLLKQQWPAMEPLVEAFGYRNVRVEGYEADDVIASLAERALRAEPPVPVMIVTGDRDVFQLIDEDGLVKVMATSRGITDTKIYDRQAVIDRYGIPPELIPDFYGLKGDTSDNIPGVPGIGDKTASELIQSFGTLEERARAHRRRSTAPKRKQNLHRARRERARVQAPGDGAARRRGRLRHRGSRPRASPTARACARCSASTSCATRCGAWRRRSATPTSAAPRAARRGAAERARARGRAARHRASRRAAVRAARRRATRARPPEGELFAEGAAVALRGRGRAARCSPASARARRRSSRRCGERPVVAHDAKALGAGAARARPRHAARRLPARAGAARLPVRGAVRGARPRERPRRPARGRGGAARRARRLAARADRRARPGAA